MTRAIDLPHGTWCTGLPNYAAGALPWSGTSVVNNPAYNYFTPGVPIAAQEMNSLLADVSQAYNALVTWVATSGTLAAPADLTAMTDAVVDGETRYIPNFGLYQYHTSPVVITLDGLQSVAGHTGGGTQWVLADYATRTPLLWAKAQVTYAGTALSLAGSFDTTDPAARNAGNKGREICGGATFSVIAGDIFEISYTVNMALQAGNSSDVVTGVRYAATTYISESLDTGAQVTGSPANGVEYTSFASGNDLRIQIHRHFYWVATVTGSKTFQLDAACDAQAHGNVLQGSQLTILQYRPAPG